MRNAAWIAAVLCFAGCSSLPPLDPFELPEGKAIRGQVSKPDPARLGVAVAFPAEEWSTSRKDSGNAALVRVDGPALRRDFAVALVNLGLFSSVEEVGAETVLDGVDPSLLEARAKNLDLLLVLRPTRSRVAFQGRNGWFVPSLALWVLLWFPSWWVADEDFVSEVAVRASLLRVADGKEIHAGEWSGTFETALNDFQRAWVILGLVRVPGALEPGDYEEIGNTLSPHAYNIAKIAAMKDLVAFVGTALPGLRSAPRVPAPRPGPETPGGTAANPDPKPPGENPVPRPVPPPVRPRRLAVAVGAGAFLDAGIAAVPFASEDAAAFAAHLRDREGFAEGDVKVLAGAEATLARVREALRELAGASGHPDDLLVFYYAGRGMVQKGATQPRLFLALGDTTPGNLTLSALFVPELGDLLSKVPGRVRVILDASFAGGGASRSQGDAVSGGQDVLRQSFGSRDRWACVNAAGDGTGALALDEVSRGLFTHFLVKGLAGEAEADGTEGVSVDELAKYLARNVPATADFLGEAQSPAAETRDRSAKVFP
jgi:hypothetical protein